MLIYKSKSRSIATIRKYISTNVDNHKSVLFGLNDAKSQRHCVMFDCAFKTKYTCKLCSQYKDDCVPLCAKGNTRRHCFENFHNGFDSNAAALAASIANNHVQCTLTALQLLIKCTQTPQHNPKNLEVYQGSKG